MDWDRGCWRWGRFCKDRSPRRIQTPAMNIQDLQRTQARTHAPVIKSNHPQQLHIITRLVHKTQPAGLESQKSLNTTSCLDRAHHDLLWTRTTQAAADQSQCMLLLLLLLLPFFDSYMQHFRSSSVICRELLALGIASYSTYTYKTSRQAARARALQILTSIEPQYQGLASCVLGRLHEEIEQFTAWTHSHVAGVLREIHIRRCSRQLPDSVCCRRRRRLLQLLLLLLLPIINLIITVLFPVHLLAARLIRRSARFLKSNS